MADEKRVSYSGGSSSRRKVPLGLVNYACLLTTLLGLVISNKFLTWFGLIATVMSIGWLLAALYIGATGIFLGLVLYRILFPLLAIFIIVLPIGLAIRPMDQPVLGHSLLFDKESQCALGLALYNGGPLSSFSGTQIQALKQPDTSSVLWIYSEIRDKIPSSNHDRIIHCRMIAIGRLVAAAIIALTIVAVRDAMGRKRA
ncbi:hypothetical protein [Rhodococcus opacus]|uniref:hypothetical protein n=1 Tax=Rhodococcus opacus TaxID=37919 RepID=UPI0024770FF3|nr:hypothetical protein [Rhodococcus opacus]